MIRGGSRAAATSKMERFVIVIIDNVNYYHKALYPGCCSSPKSASDDEGFSQNQSMAFNPLQNGVAYLSTLKTSENL